MKRLCLILCCLMGIVGCSSEPTGEKLMNDYLTEIRKPENIELRQVVMKFSRGTNPNLISNTYATSADIEKLTKVQSMVQKLLIELEKDWRNKAEIQYYSNFYMIMEALKNHKITFKKAYQYLLVEEEKMDRIEAIRAQVKYERAMIENAQFQLQLNSFQRNNQRIEEYYRQRAQQRAQFR